MSFLETIESARAFLERNRRVSLRVLKREFDLDDDALEELVEELVDVQQVAAREGKILSWVGAAAAEPEAERSASAAALGPEARAVSEATSETAAASTAAEAERRQLTVLFCDLVDSTRLAAGMDPEEWREVVRGYQQTAAQVVERFDGHVAQYLGDGLLVYFGWPRAHEDDAERAARAGLGIVDAVASGDPRLAVRVGIHTGPVVVGEMGGGASRETLAIGDTTNVAARIQGEAAPGTVVISEATLHLVRGIFATEELGHRELKGVTEPAELYRVLQPSGVRSRLDVARGHWTHFVGREQELGLLLDRWEQAAEGEGQTVLVTGEAGLGKSRLVQMLRERVGDQPHTWLECRSSPYSQGSALRPVIELVEQGVRIEPDDAVEEKLRKLEQGVGAASLDAQAVVPLMGDLLGIPTEHAYPPLRLSPEFQRERTLDSFVTWTLALSEIQPVLLLVEDLHWCDPSSIELFGRLNEQIPTAPMLMVLTARPEFEEPWTHPKNWTPVALGHLRRRPARELVRSLAKDGDLPEEAVGQILDRADGVPLYLEELTQAALESGAVGSTVTIPASLQDSLMARLDRLSAAKEVGQLASVLGREFSYRLLCALAELDETSLRLALEHLVEADLLYQRGSPPDASYTFKHALVQEAAYESLLRKRRAKLHRRTVAILEQGFPRRPRSEPEVLALHCEKGGLIEEASRYCLHAAEVSAGRSAHEEAIAHFTRCVALLGELDGGLEQLGLELTAQTGLGTSLQFTKGFTSEEAKAAYARARDLCEVVEDPRRLSAALWGLTAAEVALGQLVRATSLAQAMCDKAESADQRVDRVAGHQILGGILYARGEFGDAAAVLDRAVQAAQGSDSEAMLQAFRQDVGIVARAYRALNSWCLGWPDAAAADCRSALDAARALQDPFTLAFVGSFCSVVFGMRREPDQIELYATEAMDVAERFGFPLWLGVAKVLVGWSHAGGASAVEEFQEGMAVAGATGNQALVPLIMGALSDTYIAEGRFAEAVPTCELGLTLADQTGQHLWDAELVRCKAEALMRFSDGAELEGQTPLERGLEIARSQGAKSLELRAATSLARFWQNQGRRDEAIDLLQPVYDWFTEGFDTRDLKDAKALLEELR